MSIAPPADGPVTDPRRLTPYYSDDLVTLYHGDCREVAAWLDADVLVTDPPYGRGWRQGALRGHHTDNLTGIAGDETTDVRDSAVAMWGAKPAIVFGDLMLAPPIGAKQVLVYQKPRNAGLRGAVGGFRRDAEAIYIIGPGFGSGLGGSSSVIATAIGKVGSGTGLGGRTGHPNEKPLDVLETLLMRCPPGAIADPFAGSGSTLVAAKKVGRQAIGIEIEERYCEITARRLAQDVLDFGGSVA